MSTIKKLNPFHRRVGDASVRQSEYLVEISEEGSPWSVLGEITQFGVTPQYSEISQNIMGGGAYVDSEITHFEINLSYLVGTDGGRWKRLEIEKRKGNIILIDITTTTEDRRSMRLNGGSATRYNGCHLLTHTERENRDSSANSFAIANVTIYAPSDAEEILREFRPVQGV